MSTAEKVIRRAQRFGIGATLLGNNAQSGMEVSQEEQRSFARSKLGGVNLGVPVGGAFDVIHIPVKAALSATGANSGAELVFTGPGDLSGAVRPASIAERLGVRVLAMRDNARLIRVDGGIAFEWQDPELYSPVTPQDLVFGAEDPAPCVGSAQIAWSRRLDTQSDPAAESIVETDFSAAVASAIDSAVFGGSGTSGEPAGLLAAARSIETLDLSGGAIDYDDLCDLEARLADVNIDQDLAWLTSGRLRQALRKTAVLGDAAGGPCWRGNTLLDWPAFVSGHVTPAGTIALGRWRDATVIVHSIQVVIDRVTRAAAGLVVATVFAVVSVGIREASFALAVDAQVESADS